MRKSNWPQRGVMILAMASLFGCSYMKDANTRDFDLGVLRSQVKTMKTENDTLREDLATFQKEAQANFSKLQKQDTELKTGLMSRLEALQGQLTTLQRDKDALKSELTGLQRESAASISSLQKDDAALRNGLTSRLDTLQTHLNTVQREKDGLKNELTAFQKETAANQAVGRRETGVLKAYVDEEIKKVQTDVLYRFDAVQKDIRVLSTGVDEYTAFSKTNSEQLDGLRGDLASRTRAFDERVRGIEEKSRVLDDRSRTLDEKNKGFEERFKSVDDRLRGVDERIARVDGKIDGVSLRQIQPEKPAAAVTSGVGPAEPGGREREKEMVGDIKASSSVGPATVYNDAYQSFQRGDLDGSLKKFDSFLKQYPNTELSDNAQFWIGETFYRKKDYERAILEYEKVIARYPEGDKVAEAIFKQALAFLNMGDALNARNLLRRVVERYPQSDVAEPARRKFDEIGR
jgi:tol-pal system protein YbgF